MSLHYINLVKLYCSLAAQNSAVSEQLYEKDHRPFNSPNVKIFTSHKQIQITILLPGGYPGYKEKLK